MVENQDAVMNEIKRLEAELTTDQKIMPENSTEERPKSLLDVLNIPDLSKENVPELI